MLLEIMFNHPELQYNKNRGISLSNILGQIGIIIFKQLFYGHVLH